MGYYSDVHGTVVVDTDKAVAIVKNSNTSTKNATDTLADNIKNALVGVEEETVSDRELLKQVYDDWAVLFLAETYLHDTFEDFVNSGEISGAVYEMKVSLFAEELKQFVEKYRDAIVSLDVERDGEDSGDVERFEVRNVNGKNVLYIGTPVITFDYEPA